AGRKRLLVAAWAVVMPVPVLIALAPSWWFIVGANILLGVSQGLAWSMTVVMKIDLAGPARRGLALGLNEAAGYLGVAAAAFATGALASAYAPRTVVWVGAAAIAAGVRHGPPGRRACLACARARLIRAVARRRDPARCGDGDGLPDAARGRVGCGATARPCPRSRRLPLLARLRLRLWRTDCGRRR